jgi:hypothetical protein
LIWVGLGAQLVGVAAQAAFHVGGDAVAPLLTEARTSVIDHVVSNLGVACLAWQAGRWIRSGAGWVTLARRAMVVGAAVQVAGALVDAVGHVRGGEQPLGFAAIGVGYVLVAGGAIGSLRTERRD